MRSKILALYAICFFCLISTVLYGQTIVAGAATGIFTSCVGTPSDPQQIIVTGTGLSSGITAMASTNFELSLIADGPYADIITLPQNGSTVYVRCAAVMRASYFSGFIRFSATGANPVSIQLNGVIKELPVVNPIADQVLSNGSLTTAVNFTGTGLAYKWINSNPDIGIGASGSGNIPSFTTVNTSTNPITATFTATPVPSGLIYAANQNDSKVSVINTATNNIVTTIAVDNGPTSTLVGPDQTKVYVTCGTGDIDVINAINNTVATRIHVGGIYSTMLLSLDKSKLYVLVSNGAAAGNFVVIDLTTNTIIGTVTTGPIPTFAVNGNDGIHVYLTTFGVNGGGPAYSINTSTFAIDHTFSGVTSVATSILLTPDGTRLYLSDDTGNSGKIVVINLLSNTVINIPVGNLPWLPSMSPDGSRLYVSNTLSNTVSVINTATNTVIATIHTGNYGRGTALTPDGKFLYVTNRSSMTVSVINTATNAIIATISLSGIEMDNPVMSPDGNTLYVPDYYDSVIHVINTATNTFVTDIPVANLPNISSASISPGNGCTGAPITFNITVAPPMPSITRSGTPNPVNTTYGAISASTSFTVSGANLSAGITVTLPPGFEVSTNNVNFSNAVTVGGANFAGPATIYIRLAATTNAGTYNGNIVLSSAGAASVNVNMPNSIVSPSTLNINGTYAKLYGETLSDFTIYYNTPNFTFNPVGLHNGNTFKSIKFSFGSGAASTDAAGTYPRSVTLSDFEGDNGFIPSNYTINYFPFDLTVSPALITITAGNVNKPYGTTLANETASANFTVTGLQNNETIGNVRINYGQGASSASTSGLYTGSVIPSGAAGGTFLPGNYAITYQPGNLIVDAPLPPVIHYTGTPSALQTVYGTPSVATVIRVSGINLASGIVITPPVQFQVSIDNNNFNNTISLAPDASNSITATTIYIRLPATAPAGNYTGSLTLNSSNTGATNISLTGIVTPAPLTITPAPATKIYGTILSGTTRSNGFTATGLQNSETIGTITLTYGYGSAASDPAGVYNASLVPLAVTGGSFNSNNYSITYLPASITVNQALLTITANNLSRAFAAPNPALTVTYNGFVNNENPAQLTTLPTISTNAVLTSPAGQYPVIASGAFSQNYAISYISGILTVYAAPQNIKVPNTFTPNGDGINDLWNIADLQYYPNSTIEVYNRNGQSLYHSRGYSYAWDGTNNNKPVPFGTYYYIISLNDGTLTKLSGYVTIVK